MIKLASGSIITVVKIHTKRTDDVNDGLQRAQDAAQHLGVLLSQVLVQNNPQVTHQFLLQDRRQEDVRVCPQPQVCCFCSVTSWQVFITTAVREMRSAAC